LPEDDLQIGEHAGQQLAVGVGQRGAHEHVTRGIFDLGVNGADAGSEHSVRISRDADLHLLTEGQFWQHLFRHEEVGVEAGRENAFLGQRGIQLRDTGRRFFLRGGEFVEIASGNGTIAHQFAAAREVQLRQTQISLGGAEQTLLHIAVELHERLADLDL
nr:hypothetical protein [Tanacetum cinerariifolium]